MVAGLVEVGVDALQTQCHGRIGATALVGGRVAGVHLATWTVHIDRLLMQYKGVRERGEKNRGGFVKALGVSALANQFLILQNFVWFFVSN